MKYTSGTGSGLIAECVIPWNGLVRHNEMMLGISAKSIASTNASTTRLGLLSSWCRITDTFRSYRLASPFETSNTDTLDFRKTASATPPKLSVSP
jgi:hypothetical protein